MINELYCLVTHPLFSFFYDMIASELDVRFLQLIVEMGAFLPKKPWALRPLIGNSGEDIYLPKISHTGN